MASSSRTQVISLYRMLMKESKKFPSYNFRTYALRRVRDGFRHNMHVDDPKTLDVLLNRARESLALIRRQLVGVVGGNVFLTDDERRAGLLTVEPLVTIGQLYASQKTVVENKETELSQRWQIEAQV